MTALAGAAPEEASARPALWERLEMIAVVGVMVWFTEAWVMVVAGYDPNNPVDSDVLRQMWLPAYAVILALAATSLPRFPSIFIGLMVSVPLVVLAFASSEWSILPDVTTRRAFALAVTSVFGFYLAARFTWRELIELAAAAFLIVAAGSLLAAVLAPSIGIDQTEHVGSWRGLFGHKNALGGTMVRAAHACACAAIFVPARRWLWIGGTLLSAALVVASTSTTSLLGLALTGGGLIALATLRRGGVGAVALVWLGMVFVAAAGVAVATMPDAVFGFFGKDATLTGRTEIWVLISEKIAERPLLGYGFGAFWADRDYGPSAVLAQQLDWVVPSAHNGWLETMLQLGMVGLVVFSVHFAVTTAAALGRLWSGPEAYWTVLSLLLLMLFSVSESSIMQQNSLVWALYLATTAKLLQLPVRSRDAPAPRPPVSFEATRLA